MYCNTIELYCEEGARQGWTVLQYSAQLCHNIVIVAATQGATWCWARAGKHGRRAWALGEERRQASVGARAGAGKRQQRAGEETAWACAAGGAQASWAYSTGGA